MMEKYWAFWGDSRARRKTREKKLFFGLESLFKFV
jgi:hypothetical protein